MTNRELDCLIIGFSVGALTFLWVGYWLRKRVERWHARSQARAHQRALGPARRDVRHIPFGDLSGVPHPEQDARAILSNPRPVPIKRRGEQTLYRRPAPRQIPICDPSKIDPAPIPVAPDGFQRFDDEDKRRAEETARLVRDDAVAAISGLGYKRATAEAALDACTLAERAGGLESWVAAALSRAAAKP